MIVVVYQTRYHGAPVHVDRPGAVLAPPERLLADRDEPPLLDPHRRNDRVVGILSDNLAVEHNDVARAATAVLISIPRQSCVNTDCPQEQRGRKNQINPPPSLHRPSSLALFEPSSEMNADHRILDVNV